MPPEVLEAPEESFVDDVVEQQDSKTNTPNNEPATPATATPKNEEWKTALAELTQNVNKIAAPKTPEPKAPTEDEIAEQWALWRPEKKDPDFLKKFLRLNPDMDPAEAQAAIASFQPLFDDMRNGLARQSVVGAVKIMQEKFDAELKKLREEFAPIQETVSKSRQEKLRSDFESSYPELADPKYAKILKLVSAELNDKSFDSPTSYFKALAEGAAKELSDFTGQPFVLGASPKQNKPAVTSPKLPRTSVGGTGGSGAGKTVPTKTSDDDSSSLDWVNN